MSEKGLPPELEPRKLQFIKKKSINKLGLYAIFRRSINVTLNEIEDIINGIDGVVFYNFSFDTTEKEVGLIYMDFKDGSCLIDAKHILEDIEITGKDKNVFDCYLEGDFYKKFTDKTKLKFLIESAEKFHEQQQTNTNEFISIEAELKGSSFEESPQRPRIRKRTSEDQNQRAIPGRAPRLNQLAEDFKSVHLEVDNERQRTIQYPTSQQYFYPVQPGYPYLPVQPDPSFHYQFQQQFVYSPQQNQQGYYQYPNQMLISSPVIQRQRDRDTDSPGEVDSVKFERGSRLYVTFDKSFSGEEHILRDAFKLAAPDFEYISKVGIRSYAFVKYKTSASAKVVMEKLHDKILGGRHIKVTIAQPPRSTKRLKTTETEEGDEDRDTEKNSHKDNESSTN